MLGVRGEAGLEASSPGARVGVGAGLAAVSQAIAVTANTMKTSPLIEDFNSLPFVSAMAQPAADEMTSQATDS